VGEDIEMINTVHRIGVLDRIAPARALVPGVAPLRQDTALVGVYNHYNRVYKKLPSVNFDPEVHFGPNQMALKWLRDRFPAMTGEAAPWKNAGLV